MFWNEFESRQKEREKQAVLHREALRKQQEDNKAKKMQDRIRDITEGQNGPDVTGSNNSSLSLKQLDHVASKSYDKLQSTFNYQPLSRSER